LTAAEVVQTTAAGTNATGWGRPVAVLALGSFAMGTDSFVLAGILPQISDGLGVSTAAAGQTITAFAVTYGLAAPFLAVLTSRVPRKPLLALALALFTLANLGSAAAPSLTILLLARVLAGLGAQQRAADARLDPRGTPDDGHEPVRTEPDERHAGMTPPPGPGRRLLARRDNQRVNGRCGTRR
jgi:Major Facilitator Superfamily